VFWQIAQGEPKHLAVVDATRKLAQIEQVFSSVSKGNQPSCIPCPHAAARSLVTYPLGLSRPSDTFPRYTQLITASPSALSQLLNLAHGRSMR
jgi:hypothetical protein